MTQPSELQSFVKAQNMGAAVLRMKTLQMLYGISSCKDSGIPEFMF